MKDDSENRDPSLTTTKSDKLASTSGANSNVQKSSLQKNRGMYSSHSVSSVKGRVTEKIVITPNTSDRRAISGNSW